MQFQLASLREEIIVRSRAGEQLTTITSELIDPTVADDDEKAALWLLAWCERRDRRGAESPAAGSPQR